MIKLTAALLIALLAGYALHAWAQSRVDVRPTVTPMGTSSSNGVSFAWFYDAPARTVYLCRAGQASNTAPECSATTTLP
jgi:hypothetical protein